MTLADAVDVLIALAWLPCWRAAKVFRPLRPLPRLLALGLATDAAQRLLALVYHRPPGIHYQGADRVLFHVAQSAHLAWPVAATAFAWWALGPTTAASRRPWPMLPLWAVATASAVLLYPHHSPDVPSPVYAATQAATVLADAVIAGLWLRRHGWPGALQTAAIVVACGEGGVLVAPYLDAYVVGSDAVHLWSLTFVSRVPTFCALAVVGWLTWRRWR